MPFWLFKTCITAISVFGKIHENYEFCCPSIKIINFLVQMVASVAFLMLILDVTQTID